MRIQLLPRQSLLAAPILAFAATAGAYDSGSTGADGAFNPTVNTELQLPPSGVFNYTTVNIPTGVTVTFKKNASNTPVIILASGDVTIAGIVKLDGKAGTSVAAAGDGNVGDDGLPGIGGAGGYNGGSGGIPGTNKRGGDGLGPGGGISTIGTSSSWPYLLGGGGAGFGAVGGNAYSRTWISTTEGAGGASYGSSLLLPLIGGSGGGGGAGGTAFAGSGGGGGGGAILIASSGTVNISGSLTATGGAGGLTSGDGQGSAGGGGSGGGIRVVATTITGNGTINAAGGAAGTSSTNGYVNGGAGSVGRVRLESEIYTRTAASTPQHSFGTPGATFIAGFPTLRISSVAGVAAPAEPTGNADIVLPSTTVNPVTVVFTTTGVPVGNTVTLKLSPSYGATTSVISPALAGTTDSATASVSITLPSGASTLSATTTYTIVAALGDALSRFAEGERVEKVTLLAQPGKANEVVLTTVSGKAYSVPHAALAMAGG